MKWTTKLLTEAAAGQSFECELLRLERPERLTVDRLGLSLAEAKELLAALQRQLVPAQVVAHSQFASHCPRCGQALRSRGFYQARFRSLFGQVPVRVRRRRLCACYQGGDTRSFLTVCAHNHPVAPELSLLTAVASAPNLRQGSR